MKIKILKYKVYRGNHVIVQSHNNHKGIWKENPTFDFHLNIAKMTGKYGDWHTFDVQEYEVER